MTYLLSIDPGESTGIVLGAYSDTKHYERIQAWQIEGGLEGFLNWAEDRITPSGHFSFDDGGIAYNRNGFSEDKFSNVIHIVSEKFVLRAQDFVANTEPLRIEGAMVALDMAPIWQLRTDKALVPDRILKDNGLWLTGKDVGCKDARDANDATIHALAYLKKKKHLPTLKRFWYTGETNNGNSE